MLGAVWNKLGARVVPKPSITMPRCFYKSGRVVLENIPEKELILNVMLHEKCEANPHRCLIPQTALALEGFLLIFFITILAFQDFPVSAGA